MKKFQFKERKWGLFIFTAIILIINGSGMMMKVIVDDASRASVFYLKHYLLTGREESLIKNHRLIDFLLYMQAQNGFFYNFIWEDHSVNKDYRTSVAEPNFWSWRALWALTEAHSFYKKFIDICRRNF
jgi:hypothetical protein